ncbi:MAG: nitroreductase family protein [Streptococcaceae bacterium]|jgi:nitroreductase|nr:nitroreductase family protein [Streptococcaceae bacterium]
MSIKNSLIEQSHIIEKGLSHIDFRYGFGELKLNEIRKTLDLYNENDFSKLQSEYQLALSCLNEYKKKHEEMGGTPKFFNQIFSKYMHEIDTSIEGIAGSSIVFKTEKVNNKRKDYKTLVENRVSIREFENSKVDLSLIEQVISLSKNTPSACNRQSARIKIITNATIINKTIDIQGGFKGYSPPPLLALITIDSHCFASPREKNQGYIDGGLFAMSFLNNLEYVGLGACPLHAMFTIEKEKKIRELLNIPVYEEMILFVAIGNLLEETPYCKSWRKSEKEITHYIS